MKEFSLIKTNNNYFTPDFFEDVITTEHEYIAPPFITRQEYNLLLDNESIGGANVIEIKLSTIINHEENIYKIFDGDSLTISDLGEAIIDQESNELKEILNEEFPNFFSGELIYIDSVFVDHEYRKKKLGTNLLLNILNDYVGEHFLMIVKPYPYELRPTNKVEFNKSKEDLISLYTKLGFVKIDGIDDYMFLNKLD